MSDVEAEVNAPERVQELLTELARRQVPVHYPYLVETCKVAVLLRILAAAGIQLPAEQLDAELAHVQVGALEAILAKTQPAKPRLYVAHRR